MQTLTRTRLLVKRKYVISASEARKAKIPDELPGN
jgi:hypothetical protein